jgi:regulation of enolase protein 1 (concanavalin A-like superfamily)
MSWPLSQDYNESIQDPRNSFGDAELKTGEAVTNALGIPLPRSGNFADVYELRCPSGSRWAVKCFTREVHGLRERYNEISKYLRQVNLPFMVDFQYLEQGIRVRGAWYPALKMQWVEGFVLNEFVRDNLDKKPILQALGQIWLRMVRRLREANLAHCDLQHGNVLFVPGSSANSLAIKLIDYDGMCVPALAGVKSGEVGHPAYQHPERLRTGAYNPEVDRFSLLAIATGLRCLAVGGRSLWERYDNGDNLLFRQSDLQAPTHSPLFQELLAISDPQAQMLVKELYRACQEPLADVPLLTDLLPEEKPAGKAARSSAIAQQPAAAQGPDWDFGDDEKIAEVVRKRKRAERKVPLWAWGAIGGAAAVLLLCAGVGTALVLRNGSTRKEETPVAQNKPDVKPPIPAPKPPAEANPQPQPANDNRPGEGENKPPAVAQDPPPNRAEPARLAGEKPIFQLSPRGDAIALANPGEKTWRLVDPRSKAVLHEFAGHEGAVTALTFSRDGRRVATAGADKTLLLWDAANGQRIGKRIPYAEPVLALSLSPDNKEVAVVTGGPDIAVWNFDTGGGAGYHNEGHRVLSVAFAPDGQRLLAGFDKSGKPEDDLIFPWPLAQGLPIRACRGPSSSVTAVAVSPDGQFIASGHSGGERNSVFLWDAATGKSVRQHAMEVGAIHQVAFSPDGRFVLASAGSHYHVWPVEPTAKAGLLGMGGADVRQDLITVAFTPDSAGVTFVFRKADRVTPAQTIRLPGTAVAGNPAGQVRTVYLADVPETSFSALKFDKRDGSTLNGKASPNCLFLHPGANVFAQVTYHLRKKYSRFKATVGIRDGANGNRGSGTPLTFLVSGDGKELWKSTPLQKCGDTRDCTVSVAGVDRLELRVDCPGDAFCAHAIWAEPRLEEDSFPPVTAAWNAPVDPDGDCQFRDEGGKLTITLPEKKSHDLSVENRRMNAPRLLRDVEGDFTAQVHVTGEFPDNSIVAAGLLLMADEKTYVRLERGRVGERAACYWEQRQDGKKMPDSAILFAPETEGYVLLERRGGKVFGSHSTDGKAWTNLKPFDIDLPQKVKIGVAALAISKPFAPSFDQFQLKQGQGPMVAIDKWLTAAPAVAVKPPPKPAPRPARPRRNRMAAPGENQLADARKQIRVMYRDDYKEKSKRALAAQLYEESMRQGDLAVRYAMLTESREAAAQSGDFAAAIRAVSRLCEQFADDPLELKCRAIEETLPAVSGKTDYRVLTQKALLLIDRALIGERYELADRLLKIARAAADKADMSTVLKKAVDHSAKQLDSQRADYEAVKSAAAKLETNPEDEEASLALGKFRCITRDDWGGGLPLLEHGSDAGLRELARKDLAAAPDDASAHVALGDAWLERAGKANGKEKAAYLRRAYYLYQDSLAEVDRLDRKEQAHVKQQVGKLTALPEFSRSFADLEYSGPTVSRKSGVNLLHLGPHQVVATRRLYRGPIDIRVTAVIPKGHIRISFLNGGEMTLDPDNNNYKVRIYYPFGSDADERNGLANTSFGRTVPGGLQEIRMKVTTNGWEASVNNQGAGGQGGNNIGAIDYMPAPVRVWSDDSEIDIKSIVVKPTR